MASQCKTTIKKEVRRAGKHQYGYHGNGWRIQWDQAAARTGQPLVNPFLLPSMVVGGVRERENQMGVAFEMTTWKESRKKKEKIESKSGGCGGVTSMEMRVQPQANSTGSSRVMIYIN